MPRDSTSTHALRVLVVEDEALIALETTGHLQDWGYRVAGVAGTFREALAAARDAEIDVALVDVNLRHGDSGVDVARELKAGFGIEVVIVTGFSAPVSRRHLREADPLACLFQPFEPSALRPVPTGGASV